ncbi:MAG: metal-dependent transcriptional regulator [Candidatus Eisenbacteria sp.]|nr:metal-dependent transcriptional regulator [Candidatus Eisenbacteria bacterium]
MESRQKDTSRKASAERTGSRGGPRSGGDRPHSSPRPSDGLSETLEDYLEIILALAAEQPEVRVRDIARAKAVRMPTVTWALRALAEKGLVEHEARELVELTPEGAAIATRVAARHSLLQRFLAEILGVAGETAEQDACRMEHHLSPHTLERLAAFVEYIQTCPGVEESFLERFRTHFGRAGMPGTHCPDAPEGLPPQSGVALHCGEQGLTFLPALPAGARGLIARLWGDQASRFDLMRRGLLPGVAVEVVGGGGQGNATIIRVQGRELALPPQQAAAILLTPAGENEGGGDATQ